MQKIEFNLSDDGFKQLLENDLPLTDMAAFNISGLDKNKILEEDTTKKLQAEIAQQGTISSLIPKLNIKEIFRLMNYFHSVGEWSFSKAISAVYVKHWEGYIAQLESGQSAEERKALQQLLKPYSYLFSIPPHARALRRLIEIDPDNRAKWESHLAALRLASPDKSPEDVKDIHEDIWSNMGDNIVKKIKAGETAVSIILKQAINIQASNMLLPTTSGVAVDLLESAGEKKNSRGMYFHAPGVSGGKYTLIPNAHPFTYVLQNYLTSKTTSVVELGSGWGRNLFMFYFILGRSAFDLNFYALEYSDAGQRAAEEIASVASEFEKMKLKAHPLDYLNPDISYLKDMSDNVLYFSNFSIEQVERVGNGTFQQMIDMGQNFTCLHFEPAGWQRRKDLVEQRKANNTEFFGDLAEQRFEHMYDEDGVDKNQAINSFKMKYNYDLLEVLHKMQDEGKIDIHDISYHHSPPNRIKNPGTIVAWSPKGRGLHA